MKNLLLPVGILLVLLLDPGRIPRSWAILPGVAFFLWSLQVAYPFPSLEAEWFVGTTALAFLLGVSGVRPAFPLALGAMCVGILKGWDDLLFLRNWGGGIPFTATSFFVHKNLFTLILSPALLLLTGAVLSTRLAGRARWWASAVFVSGLLLLLVSDGRGALVGFGAGGVLLILLGRWGSPRARKAWILVGVLLLSAIGWSFKDRLPQTSQEIGAIVRSERVTSSVPDRFRPWVWTGSLRLLREAPWTGIGVGAFRYRIEAVLDPWLDQLRDRTMKVDVAHSHWLQTMVERGALGLAMEIALLGTAMAGAARTRRIPLLAALVAMSIHALVGEGFEYPLGAVLWWYLIGLGSAQWGATGTISARIPTILGAALLAYPFWMQVRTHRAEVLVSRGSDLPPVTALSRAIELAPGSPKVLVEVARYQTNAGGLREARMTLEKARAIHPWLGASAADLPLAHLWRLEGRRDSSDSILDGLLSLHPNDPEVLKATARRRRSEEGCVGAKVWTDSVDRALRALIRQAPIAPAPPPPWWVGSLASHKREEWRRRRKTSATAFQHDAWRAWRELRLPGCEP